MRCLIFQIHNTPNQVTKSGGDTAVALARYAYSPMQRIFINLLLAILIPAPTLLAAEIDPCTRMEITTPDQPCIIKVGKTILKLQSTGEIYVKPPNGRGKSVKLRMPRNYYIEKFRHELLNKKLYFVFEISNSESAKSIITEFNLKKKRFDWLVIIRAFNISPLLVINDSVYFGGMGTVVKISKRREEVVWRHKRLYDRFTEAYHSFIRPRKKDLIIIFEEQKASNAKYKGIKKVKVNYMSGNIISK